MKLIIGLASCGIAAGGVKVKEEFERLIAENPQVEAQISETGCIGMCYKEVLVELVDKAGNSFLYGEVTPDKAAEIFKYHVKDGYPVEKYIVRSSVMSNENDSFFDIQQRIVLERCGRINPESIDEALTLDAYKGLERALREMTPEQVIQEVLDSGLRGRGGAGFPTGLKLRFAAAPESEQKYIICNADEGDPGAFMDRSVLEGDPHAVLEGLAIGGYAIGADTGYVYARAEYPIAIKRLKIAIAEAEERGYLGENIMGLGFSFKVKVKEGAGAFVCGEETALIASIEGRRGMPGMRPPFPANRGLFQKPSNINNVETLANIGWILRHGAAAYASYGTEESGGTKVFALAGKIARGGLIEIPFGVTIRDVIFNIGGGTKTGKPFKAVQMGGPSGGCIPKELIDTKIDYSTLSQTGAIVGSGGMIVLDEDNCMVDIARYFLNFTQSESCGKCTFCRIGTKRMLEILNRITEGEGRAEDLDDLERLAHMVKTNSLCGLGQTAPNPVLTTLKYFRNEYEAHINDRKCPAKQCVALISYSISEETCTGCGACVRACPVSAISGERGQAYVIAAEKCTKCGTCLARCRFSAISVG